MMWGMLNSALIVDQTQRRSSLRIKISSRKIVFFLFIYYLCLDSISYMVRHYFSLGNIIFKNPLLNAIKLEHIVFVLTIVLILSRYINVGKYLNFHSGGALILFIWIFFIVLVSYFDVGQVSFGQYFSFSTLIIGRGFIFILLGLNIHNIYDMLKEKKLRRIFYTIATIYFTVILLSAIYNPLAGNLPWYLRGITTYTGNIDSYVRFDYLSISNTCALLLLFIISINRNIHIKLLISIFGSFLLVLCLSRASLICFVTAAIITFIIHFFKVGIKKIGTIALLLILLIFLSVIYVPLLLEQTEYLNIGISKRFNPIAFRETDGSYFLRRDLLDKGLFVLKETWFFGRYMSEIAEGKDGTYIHNWLSFWSAYGIGPFLLFSYLLVTASFRITRLFLKDSKSPKNELLFLWSIYMILIIVFSRAYDYYYIWFILLSIPMINQGFTKKYGHNISRKM